MERIPNFRIVGNAPEEEKRKTKEELRGLLFNHLESIPPETLEEIERLECPKTEQEITLISFVNEETAKLMEELGLSGYKIPPENYHIIPHEYSERLCRGGPGVTYSLSQLIILNAKKARENPLLFATIIFHETLHLKAHLSVELGRFDNYDKEEMKKTNYRGGVTVISSQKKDSEGDFHIHFQGLNEAIVSETEKRFLPRILEHPEFTKEKDWLMSPDGQRLKEEFAIEKEISEEDVVWVEEKGEERNVTGSAISYRPQREVLNYLCSEIQQEFPDEFQNVDDVFKVFLKAHFTGQLLRITRLIERTFGKGSFRNLGEMSLFPSSGNLCLKLLKEEREKFTGD